MANLADFVFLDTSSTVTTSNTFYLPYDTEQVTLQVTGSGTIDVTVQGKADVENGSFATVGVVKCADFQTAEKIEEAGIYIVPAAGIRQMQVVNAQAAGSVTVFGSAVN